MKLKRDAGFTLIEAMVIVLIIAILVAIAIPTFLGARRRGQIREACGQKAEEVCEEYCALHPEDVDCRSPGEPDPDIKHKTVTLDDGRTVDCIVHNEQMSCDWGGAASPTPTLFH